MKTVKYYCPYHRTEMMRVRVQTGGGGYDNEFGTEVGEFEVGFWIREWWRCQNPNCHSKVVISKESVEPRK